MDKIFSARQTFGSAFTIYFRALSQMLIMSKILNVNPNKKDPHHFVTFVKSNFKLVSRGAHKFIKCAQLRQAMKS